MILKAYLLKNTRYSISIDYITGQNERPLIRFGRNLPLRPFIFLCSIMKKSRSRYQSKKNVQWPDRYALTHWVKITVFEISMPCFYFTQNFSWNGPQYKKTVFKKQGNFHFKIIFSKLQTKAYNFKKDIIFFKNREGLKTSWIAL